MTNISAQIKDSALESRNRLQFQEAMKKSRISRKETNFSGPVMTQREYFDWMKLAAQMRKKTSWWGDKNR